MRILILLAALFVSANAVAQVAGTPCNRWEAVVENAGNGEYSAGRRANLARAAARTQPGINVATATNAEICTAANAAAKAWYRSLRGSEAAADQAAATNTAVNAAEAEAEPDGG